MNREGKLIPLVISLLFFTVILIIISVVVIFFSYELVDGNSLGSQTTQSLKDLNLNKYLWVDNEGRTKMFESVKEINDFSLYEMEYGIKVFPMSSSRKSTKKYICECDLSELEAYIRDEGITSSDFDTYNRRSGIATRSGIILASAIGILMMLLKTNIITLRIFARDEMEAKEFASKEIKSRIYSEIESENWEERFRKIEEDLKRLGEEKTELEEKFEDKIRKLEDKIEEITYCDDDDDSIRDEYPDFEDVEDEHFLYCSGDCDTPGREDDFTETTVDCLRFADWKNGEERIPVEYWKTFLRKECRKEFKVGVVEDTLECETIDIGNPSYFLRQTAFLEPNKCGDEVFAKFLDEYSSHCEDGIGIRSCYDNCFG